MKVIKQMEKMRDRGNPEQEAALHKLLSALKRVRGLADVNYTTELRPVKLLVMLGLPNFPVISIGASSFTVHPSLFPVPSSPSFPPEPPPPNSLA
jgi:hypothetical protein